MAEQKLLVNRTLRLRLLLHCLQVPLLSRTDERVPAVRQFAILKINVLLSIDKIWINFIYFVRLESDSKTQKTLGIIKWAHLKACRGESENLLLR